MECEKIQRQIVESAPGAELPAPVREHVARCVVCRGVQKTQEALMKTMSMQAEPSAALDDVVRGLARSRLAGVRTGGAPLSGWRLWVRFAAAAAVAVAGILAFTLFLRPAGEKDVTLAGVQAPAASRSGFAAGAMPWDYDVTRSLAETLLMDALSEKTEAPRPSPLEESLMDAEVSLVVVETDEDNGSTN